MDRGPDHHPPVPRLDHESDHIGERDVADWRSAAGRSLARAAVRLGAWVAAHGVLLLTALVGGIAAVGLTAVAAEVYDGVTERDDLAALDQPVLDWAVGWRTQAVGEWVTWFTDLGSVVGMSVIAVVGTAFVALRWRTRTAVLLMVVGVAGSLAMTVAGKDLVGRNRPPQTLAVPPYETSPSFPSGHTLNATVVVGVLVYLVLLWLDSARARLAAAVVAGVFVVAMGLSRVVLGHHWLTDVVAAWALGLAWVSVVVTAHRLYLTVRRRQPPEEAQAARGPVGRSTTQASPSGRKPSRS